MFGKPEDFFTDNQFKTLHISRVPITEVSQLSKENYNQLTSYSLHTKQFHVGTSDVVFKEVSSVPQPIPVIFDVQSKYIYGPDQFISSIVAGINKANVDKLNCNLLAAQNMYICDKAKDFADFPKISFEAFNKQNLTEGSITIELKPEDYVEKFQIAGQDNFALLIRNGKYGLQETTNVLSILGYESIWLGRPVFKSHYLVFNHDDKSISAAKLHTIKPESWKMDPSKKTALIVAGTFLGLLFILAMLILLPKLMLLTGYKQQALQNIVVQKVVQQPAIQYQIQ